MWPSYQAVECRTAEVGLAVAPRPWEPNVQINLGLFRAVRWVHHILEVLHMFQICYYGYRKLIAEVTGVTNVLCMV